MARLSFRGTVAARTEPFVVAKFGVSLTSWVIFRISFRGRTKSINFWSLPFDLPEMKLRKLRKAAVVIAVLGSVGLLGAGTADAHGGSRGGTNSFSGNGEDGRKGDVFNVSQGTECRSHDLNIDVLGAVGVLNGVLGGALNGEGNAGAQQNKLGSSMGCNNAAFEK